MKIGFHGAAHTVTGSQHLLSINGVRLLLECGLYQGPRAESYIRNRHFPFDPSKIDAVILSHAHIDHSGNLPNLVKQGYRGPIYTPYASAHLANVMLIDSGHIQESDAKYVNKRHAERGEPPVEPLYTQEDAAMVAPLFWSKHYDEVKNFDSVVIQRQILWEFLFFLACILQTLFEEVLEKWQQMRIEETRNFARTNYNEKMRKIKKKNLSSF